MGVDPSFGADVKALGPVEPCEAAPEYPSILLASCRRQVNSERIPPHARSACSHAVVASAVMPHRHPPSGESNFKGMSVHSTNRLPL
jgi:hypothetical protein